jgi:hypothetical protein
VSIGAMTQAQVDEVLKLQLDAPNSARERMFGWIALKKSYVTEDTMKAAAPALSGRSLPASRSPIIKRDAVGDAGKTGANSGSVSWMSAGASAAHVCEQPLPSETWTRPRGMLGAWSAIRL